MSKIEDILYEAHELGCRERVFTLVREYQSYCGSQGQWYDQSKAYEDALQKAKEECKSDTQQD